MGGGSRSGPLGLSVRTLSTASTVQVVVRDPSGALVAAATGPMPLTVSTSVQAGTQTITVKGPARLRFSLSLRYVSP